MDTNQHRDYAYIGELSALIVGDDTTPIYMCPDDGLLVVTPEIHDQWHADQSKPTIAGIVVPCRCQDDLPEGEGTYWFCPQHQRANYQGNILSDGGVLTARSATPIPGVNLRLH